MLVDLYILGIEACGSYDKAARWKSLTKSEAMRSASRRNRPAIHKRVRLQPMELPMRIADLLIIIFAICLTVSGIYRIEVSHNSRLPACDVVAHLMLDECNPSLDKHYPNYGAGQ